MKKLLLPLIVLSIFNGNLFAKDENFLNCGVYSLFGYVDCTSLENCYLVTGKGSFSEKKYSLFQNYTQAKKLHNHPVKTKAEVQNLTPFSLFIEGLFIPILDDDLHRGVEIIGKQECQN